MKLKIDQALQKALEAHKAGRVQEADRFYTAILRAEPDHPDANHNLGVLAVSIGKIYDALPFLRAALEANPNVEQFWLSYIDALIKLNCIKDAQAAFSNAKRNLKDCPALDELAKDFVAIEEASRNEPSPYQVQSLIDLYNQGQLQKALGQSKSLVVKFPNSLALWNILGASLKGLGQRDLAIETYMKAIAINPNDANTHYNMGVVLQEQGNKEQAIEAYRKALVIKPSYAEAFNNMGTALRDLGALEDAIEAFKKALVIRPNYAEAFNNMGIILKKQDKLDKAVEAYRKAIEIKPEYVEAYYNLGNVLKDQDNLKYAIEAYKKAIEIKPDHIAALYNMGNALKKENKLDQAIDAYNKALAIEPNYADAYNNIGTALKDQGKLEEAIKSYKKAIEIKPDHIDAHYNMGNTFYDQDKLNDAIAAYKKAVNIKPDNAQAYYNIGNVFKQQGKSDEAIEAYKRALSIRPNFAGAHNNMGNVLKSQGKLAESLIAYNKAILLNPNHADAYYNMGNALKDQGKLEEAVEAYNKALHIRPEFVQASHLLSSLTGKTTKAAPREYIENLFDGYASKFDQSLVGSLSYNIPDLVTNMVAKNNGKNSLGSTLDLGCGTGLTGEKIRAHCCNLTGIDLSKKMLEIAKSKNVYDKLYHRDIVEYLSDEELGFNCYIATDVFIYVGDLSEVFRLIKARNKKPGTLIFSTEHNKLEGFHLEKSGRYSHSKSYIEKLCKKFNFSITHFSEVNLRKENGAFLIGGLYFLNF